MTKDEALKERADQQRAQLQANYLIRRAAVWHCDDCHGESSLAVYLDERHRGVTRYFDKAREAETKPEVDNVLAWRKAA